MTQTIFLESRMRNSPRLLDKLRARRDNTRTPPLKVNTLVLYNDRQWRVVEVRPNHLLNGRRQVAYKLKGEGRPEQVWCTRDNFQVLKAVE